MTVDVPGFLSRIVRWSWAITPGLEETKTFHWVDGEGGPYDPGTVTAKAGPGGAVSATVTGTGTSRTITWSNVQTGLIAGSQWRLNFDGADWVGGRIGVAEPQDAPSTDNDWTIQLPGDAGGDGLTITVAGGGGGTSTPVVASVVLAAPSLTPEAGDPIYRVSYRPGYTDTGGEGGSARVPTGWSVDEAYEWGDDFTPAAGGTKVLVLLPGDGWPSTFALATTDALTAVSQPGGVQITLGCGGTDGPADFVDAVWIGWNLDGFENSIDPSSPAVQFVPQSVGAAQVRIGPDRTGALDGMTTLDDVLAGLDDGTIGGGAPTEDYTPMLVDGSTGDPVPTGPATWGRFTVINSWCHWECRFELLDTVPAVTSMLMVLPASVKQVSGQLRDCGTGLAILGTPLTPGELASLSVTGGDLTGAFGSPIPAYVAVFDIVDPPGPPASLGTRTPLDFSVAGGFIKFRGQFEVEPA